MPTATQTKLEPYIFFYGRCEEALKFYKDIFGGTYEAQPISAGPMADHVAPDFKDKVMHATFTAPGFSFMASDGDKAKTIDPDEGNVSLCLESTETAQAERIFKELSAGGKVTMPFGDAFWGGKFGQLVDRFGIEWMITSR